MDLYLVDSLVFTTSTKTVTNTEVEVVSSVVNCFTQF